MTKLSKADGVLLDRCVAEVERVGAFLGLTQTWVIHVRLDGLRKSAEDAQRAANVRWPKNYKEATIAFDREFVKLADDAALERTVLHELLHLVMSQLDDAMEEQIGTSSYVMSAFCDAREAVLDTLTNLMLRARDGKSGVARFTP